MLPEHRPLYKISQILLTLLLASRASRSSLQRLHLFNWALKSPERCELLRRASITKRLELMTWGFDPMLANAINYAVASDLLVQVDTGYELTTEGHIFATHITKDDELFGEEKSLFKVIGKSITEKMVEAASKEWGI